MTDNSKALVRSRRQDSKTKRKKASEALGAMIESGEPVTFPAVARRAGVSVSLLYADTELADRLSEARSRQRDAGVGRTWKLPTRSLVTQQSLRVDLANANDRVRRLSEEVSVLRYQLARQLGAESDAARGRTSSPRLEQLEERAASLEAENAQLREQVTKLDGALREANETLEAARALNRELMAGINRPERLDSRPAATTPSGTPSRRRPPETRKSRSPV